MNQSTLIGGALIFTFLLFLASRNRLGTYGAVLWGSSSAPIAPPANGNAPVAATTAATPSASAATVPATVAPASASVSPASAAPTQSATQKLAAAFGSNVQSYASTLNAAAQLAAPLGFMGF